VTAGKQQEGLAPVRTPQAQETLHDNDITSWQWAQDDERPLIVKNAKS
jgi:hypothetical protein